MGTLPLARFLLLEQNFQNLYISEANSQKRTIC
jgi:hypothetical protein